MIYDKRKRDSTWTLLSPGCYLDPEGYAHIFPDEIIAHLQSEYPEAGFNMSKEDYDMVVKLYMEAIRDRFGEVALQFLKHEREQN
jgi:hypothetical protein